jgi:hypothetical protein
MDWPPSARARQLAGRLLTPRLRATGRAAAESIGVSASTIDRLRSAVGRADGSGIVDILQVDLTPLAADGVVRFAAIDSPHAGTRTGVYDVTMIGWAVGRDAPVATVELTVGEQVLRRATVNEPRPDVAKRVAGVGETDPIGFRLTAGLVGLPPEVELSLRAVAADDTRVPLATMRLRHLPVHSSYEPALNPLMLTSPGRSGTTWVMRLLSEHPGIVALRHYPYEFRGGRYWLHMLEALSQPANHLDSVTTSNFFHERTRAGNHPYFPIYRADAEPLNTWAGRTYVEQLAAFCQQSIDGCYLEVARTQGQDAPRYFAEKHIVDRFPALAWELYPHAREVFLIRDYRDVFSSMVAFNRQRGYVAFGLDQHESDEAYIRDRLAGSLRRFRESWTARQERGHLLRYEDIVLRPEETLHALFTYLDLDAGEAMVGNVLQRASRDSDELRQHRTSDDPASSIGRWRRDLDPALQAVCAEVLGDNLAALGYDV